MPAYLTLFNWTDQGIKSVKETARRAKENREAWEAKGGHIVGIWWTLGQYDGVIIYEAPDDITATQFLIANGMQGDVRTTTLRAFGEEEIDRIVQGLP